MRKIQPLTSYFMYVKTIFVHRNGLWRNGLCSGLARSRGQGGTNLGTLEVLQYYEIPKFRSTCADGLFPRLHYIS
ncbi:hypothetical protein ACN42_g10113 [Penicillium freii]|uniref:Uncharacterized protein n=1 Tax=Penicillium freii TaxID=48697 RepID=A0A101MAN2_PENFR|nr:hypothetical protein ACN42_g10113 [Penicillium freii]